MVKKIKHISIHLLCLFLIITSFAQTPFQSESLIKYDLLTHKTDKPIPFDRSFTLVVEKLPSKNIKQIDAYEAKSFRGNRIRVVNNQGKAIKDISLNYNSRSDTLQIFFPPLKPNHDFDINIIRKLSADNRLLLLNINSLIAKGDISDARTRYSNLSNALTDPFTLTTYLSLTFTDYQTFYNSKLSSEYNVIKNKSNFKADFLLTQSNLQAIDIASTKETSDFKDGYYTTEMFKLNQCENVLLGLIDISKIYKEDLKTELEYGHLRIQNLESNIKFFDTILQRVDRLISKGFEKVTVEGNYIMLSDVQKNVSAFRDNMKYNYKLLNTEMETINNRIDINRDINEGIYLAANTLSSDLKTAGGNILFLDAGMTNILAPGLKGQAVYIPKLYYGVSIYFRAIDKNTRRNKFPSKFNPSLSTGCDNAGNCGPDYGIVTKWSIWQHLSLNLGFTVGEMTNKDFDNFYNGTSLLVGPSYRFARAFKVSTGVAFLKRSSKNPVVSDKKVVPASYLSLSVDVDFIQGLKDITSILFK